MSTIYDALQARMQQAQISGQDNIERFLENERAAYWGQLCRSNLDDAVRTAELRKFDQAMNLLLSQPPSASVGSGRRQTQELSHSKSRSVGRDILFLALGTVLGIPAGMFSNYIYDWIFPQVAAIIEQVGVQGLATTQDGFFFSAYNIAQASRDGTIDVRYVLGTDTNKYKCSVKVSKPEYFESYGFEKGCRKVVFKFKDPRRFPAEWNGRNEAVAFDISVTSEKGQVWEGTQGIHFMYYY